MRESEEGQERSLLYMTDGETRSMIDAFEAILQERQLIIPMLSIDQGMVLDTASIFQLGEMPNQNNL